MGRFRRLRKSKSIRSLLAETKISSDDLIMPFFVIDGKNKEEDIESMPGIARYSVDLLLRQVEDYVKLGGKAGLFFGISSDKNSLASQAYAKNNIIVKAIKAVKKEFPHFLIITDVCLCAYMDHGHCGVLKGQTVDNDATLPLLANMAVAHAQAGADFVAPSDMMDYRVSIIRDALDDKKLEDVGILSYAVKYASAFYGPFRDAAHSTPSSGDRKTYQMDYRNSREALKEARQDILEGADMVMVKPALAYLDIISLLRRELNVPVVAYSVSGEYSMIKAAAQKNWINEKDVVTESLTAIKRAGADVIISYYAKEALNWLKP